MPLTDNQFGALVSWVFNVGCTAATESRLVKKLNAGNQADEVCNELRRWNKVTIDGKKQISNGLVRRREDECKLYKSNSSDAIERPTRDINSKGLNLIKDYSGWHGCAIKKSVTEDKITIGYGHIVKPEDGYTINSCIDHQRGHDILINDLSEPTRCIEKIVRVQLSDDQFGALVSWAFNVGCTAATESTLVKKLNAGSQADEICNELRQWNKVTINGKKEVSEALVKWREDECKFYKSANRENATREINDKSLNFIKGFKKWQPCAYTNEVSKNVTIGYEHIVKPGESFTNGSCITEEQGLDLLRKDLSEATRCIERIIVHRSLTDNQFGALVSWTFNASEGPFDNCAANSQTPLVNKLNVGQPDEICDEFRKWHKVTINGREQIINELVIRREDECSLYKSNGNDPIVRINITCTMVENGFGSPPTCKANYHTKEGKSCYYWCRMDSIPFVPKSCNLAYMESPSTHC